MRELFVSGRLIDVALAVVGLELVVLFLMARRTHLTPRDVIGHLAAGTLLMLAIRSAATGSDYRWTLALVAASFPAHVYDLARRIERTRGAANDSARR